MGVTHLAVLASLHGRPEQPGFIGRRLRQSAKRLRGAGPATGRIAGATRDGAKRPRERAPLQAKLELCTTGARAATFDRLESGPAGRNMMSAHKDRLSREQAQLLVVDIQEKLLPSIAEHATVVAQAERMIRAATILALRLPSPSNIHAGSVRPRPRSPPRRKVRRGWRR